MQAYCFLPDHLHLLVSGTHDDSDLQVFVVGFKQRSAYAFRRKTGQRLWQYNYYDHVLQPDERWESVACYIWLNPVRKGLCERAESWPFSGSQTLDWRKLMTVGAAVWIPPWKKGVGPKA
jgi:putative transposase